MTRQEYIEKKDSLVQEITERALEACSPITDRYLLDVQIESSRLQMIPITEEFAEEIFGCFDNEITRFMYPKPAESIKETYQFIRSSIEGLKNGSNLQLVILRKLSKEFIGCAGLHRINTKTPELGIWTKKDSHGNGYGLEAITAIISWAKKNTEFEYLVYPVDKKNYPSRRIPEINGGIPSKEFKKFNQKGFELDEIEYRIYKDNKERAAVVEELNKVGIGPTDKQHAQYATCSAAFHKQYMGANWLAEIFRRMKYKRDKSYAQGKQKMQNNSEEILWR